MEQFEQRVLLSISPTSLDQLSYLSSSVKLAIQQATDLDQYCTEDLASTRQWVIGLTDAGLSNSSQLAASLGADDLGPTGIIQNTVVWEFSADTNWETVADRLDAAAGVAYAYPLIVEQYVPMFVPDDPLFPNQWHLVNTGQSGGTPGADANVEPAWDLVTGEGVVIGVMDEGVEADHPDLVNNMRLDLSHDWVDGDGDPSPVGGDGDHGTSVAGVAAGQGNNGVGVSGSAPDAEIAGLRVSFNLGFSDQTIGEIFGYKNDDIDIYNNSWGPTRMMRRLGPLTAAALETGVHEGRNGLGNIYVFSAGNSRTSDFNVNTNQLANSRYTIAIAAIDADGHFSYYSNPGAAVMVSGYSNSYGDGIYTTDRTGEDGYNRAGSGDGDPLGDVDYTSGFGGTSSAAPLVSGVIALMLEANPSLTYRDVQYILAQTSSLNDPTDPDWYTNAAGYHVNHNYGFGAIDAMATVQAAYGWETVGEEVSASSEFVNIGLPIPDGTALGLSSTVVMDDTVDIIEWVEVSFDAGHDMPGDIEVILTSPSGTQSRLAESTANSWLFTSEYTNWPLTTCRNWGESAEGEWKLEVRDRIGGTIGVWNSWQLHVYGQHKGSTGPVDPDDALVGPELIAILPNDGSQIVNDSVLHIAPRELLFQFNDRQEIDPATLGAIRITRAGGDNVLGNANDVIIQHGWTGIGDQPNQVIVRFAETLPDDLYQITIFGQGNVVLKNIQGKPFHDGQNQTITFDLDLGAQVIAVVPQPVVRDPATGALSQSRNTIEVYFNADTLDANSVLNKQFYRLSQTNETATPLDGGDEFPTSVQYDPYENKVVLTFATDLANLSFDGSGGVGALRLRIGNAYHRIETRPTTEELVGDTFNSARAMGQLGSELQGESVIISSVIEPLPYDLPWPGAIMEVGHRELVSSGLVESHFLSGYDTGDYQYGATTYYYNFGPFGSYPNLTANSDVQKNRVREIFGIYSTLLGVQFIEDASGANRGFIVGTGDLRAVDPFVPVGAGGVIGIAGSGMAIMDNSDTLLWGVSERGGNWFHTAMHEIGHLLGLGHTYDMPAGTVMGAGENPEYEDTGTAYYMADSENIYPGAIDVIHGRFLYRPDGTDVDFYKFTVERNGVLSAETVAERLAMPSLLDSVISLYDANGQLLASNDDYYSEDAFLELDLTPGTYYIAVSSTGTSFDPDVAESGLGGTSQGNYDLRLTFLPKVLDNGLATTEHLIDATGTLFDGDADGVPGGVHDFWFTSANTENTIFVDKIAPAGGDGSIAHPYNEIDQALLNRTPGQIVRIVGNRDRTFVEGDEPLSFDVSAKPTGVAVGDFNGDGALDIVAANTDDDSVSILFGYGNGTYAGQELYNVGRDPKGIAVGDLDGDGDQDIVVTNQLDRTVSLLLNDGAGGFVTTTRSVGQTPSAVKLGDLNDDGRLDIVVTNQAEDTIGVLLSSQTDLFANQVTYTVGDAPADLIIGDLNNDGKLDVAVANSAAGDNRVSILLGMGAGALAPALHVAVGFRPVSMAIGDLDGDGNRDLVTANYAGNNVSVLLGAGNGSFAPAANFAVGANPSAVALADLDDDDAIDIVTANESNGAVTLLFGNGHGAFAEDPNVGPYDTGETPKGLVLADADGDNREDILVTNSDNNTVSIILARRDAAYEIGKKEQGVNPTLPDGATMEVPKGVTVMIDAGAVLKLLHTNINVGSLSQSVDRSGGALQVLGTPEMAVCFTSFRDRSIGVDHTETGYSVNPGNWGGLVFRNEIDYDVQAGEDPERKVLETEGIFLNYVNHADIRYGGGRVNVVASAATFTPIQMIEARPTISHNTIRYSANAAISGDPNSFAETPFWGADYTADYQRIGPDIHGNHIIDNSFNCLFVGIDLLPSQPMDKLEVASRWDDLDIVHAVAANLFIQGTPGGPEAVLGTGQLRARVDGQLAIDPGIVVKFGGTRIEVEVGAQLIAEGRAGYPIVFTSVLDDRYGTGGTFDTTNNGQNSVATPGKWGGLYFAPTSSGSIDHALIAYAGGVTTIEGDTGAAFAPIEIQQAFVRVANSTFEYNQGANDGDRNGRGTVTDSVIFVRGAQPVLVGNVIRDNLATAISIDANSLTGAQLVDWGRSTSGLDAFEDYPNNYGPLVRENRLANNKINGMLVRGAVLTTESVWDDTDIVHVLRNEIVVPNFHTYGGLRLQSAVDESLVVKLQGSNAGFTAVGTPQDIDDRIGGTLQILGQPGYPVVLTALADDTVGAGLDPWGNPQLNTDNVVDTPTAGAWRSVLLERYMNDRNVAIVLELERVAGLVQDANANPNLAESIGSLAPHSQAGDDNLRLGFDVRGFIRTEDPTDVDVYAFNGFAGSEVWIDIDRTTLGLDSVVELVDAEGTVLARSNDSTAEDANVATPYGLARTMSRDVWETGDMYTVSGHDAGMRLVLPGASGELRTYYVRVRSQNGTSSGGYQLQIRLQEEQEIAGSTIQNSSIRYATNGIEVYGMPTDSPLLGDTTIDLHGVGDVPRATLVLFNPNNNIVVTAKEAGEVYDGIAIVFMSDETTPYGANYDAGMKILSINYPPNSNANYIIDAINAEGTFLATLDMVESPNNGTGRVTETGIMGILSRPISNLLNTNKDTLLVGGHLSGPTDVDWFSFQVDLEHVQSAGDVCWPAIFDIDYADKMSRPDINLYVFDQYGRLVYSSTSSSVDDDQLSPAQAGTDDLTRGSGGTADAFIGPVLLPGGEYESHGVTYYVAVANPGMRLTAQSQPYARREPVDSIIRIAQDRIFDFGQTGVSTTTALFPDTRNADETNLSIDDWNLSDVVLYLTNGDDLFTVDPFTGLVETDVTGPGVRLQDASTMDYGDLAMRDDAWLFSITAEDAGTDQAGRIGRLRVFDSGDGSMLYDKDDGIILYEGNGDPASPAIVTAPGGVKFDAMAYIPFRSAASGWVGRYVAVGHREPGPNVDYTENLLYIFNSDGTPVQPDYAEGSRLPSNYLPWGQLATSTTLRATAASEFNDGMTFSITYDTLDGSASKTFEIDMGVVVNLDGNSSNPNDPTYGTVANVQDGYYFTLGNGTSTKTFELSSGPTLQVADYTAFVDGQEFRLTDNTTPDPIQFSFEIEMAGNGVKSGNIAVNLRNATSNNQAGNIIAQAINGAAFHVTATNQNGQITLTNDTNGNFSGVTAGLTVQGDYTVTPGRIAIPFESTTTIEAFFEAVIDTVQEELPGVTGSYDADPANPRMSFLGAQAPNFTGAAPALTYVAGSASGVATGNVAVPIGAGDTADDVATAVTAAINTTTATTGLTASTSGSVVTFTGSQVSAIDVGATPLVADGIGGSGGRITGLSFIGTKLYAVLDSGAFCEITNWDQEGFELFDPPEGSNALPNITKLPDAGPALNYINVFSGVPFTGLTLGPQHVELDPDTGQGAYANVFFATDANGMLNAFTAEGVPAGVFHDAASQIQLNPGGDPLIGTGLAFSPLDYNLWHVTSNRASNAGHGVEISPDDTRLPIPEGGIYRLPGNNSFWFGYENNFHPNSDIYRSLRSDILSSYNLPGGAHGTLTTEPFSLAGYTSADLPVLYFNYYLETDGTYLLDENGDLVLDNENKPIPINAVTDSARVYVSTDGANWDLLASNIDTLNNLVMDDQNSVVRLVDASNTSGDYGWRQCRLNLGNYAGSENVRIKFEFAAAGSMEISDLVDYTGIYLRTVPATELRDGQDSEAENRSMIAFFNPMTFEVTTFEFDMGYSLVAPNSAGLLIRDGEQFSITDTYGTIKIFEFDKNGDGTLTPDAIPILVSDADSTLTVLEAMRDAILATTFLQNPETPLRDVVPVIHENRLFLSNYAVDVSQVAAPDAPDTNGDGFPDTILVREGSAPGVVEEGNVRVPIDQADMSAAAVAAALATAMDAHFSVGTDIETIYTSVKVNQDLLYTRTPHTLINPGPLFSGIAQPGEETRDTSHNGRGTQFYQNLRGQDNVHEGWYVDDLVIGFAERGEMYTDMQGEATFVAVDPLPIGVVYEGYYQLEIRRASEYGARGSLFRNWDTNDRQGDGITIEALSARDIVHRDTFTVSDGLHTQTFQFIAYPSGNEPVMENLLPDPGNIAIPFFSLYSASDMASLIASAINSVNTLGGGALDVVASTRASANGTLVELHGAASVVGIDAMVSDNDGQNTIDVETVDLNPPLDPEEMPSDDIIAVNQYDGTVTVFVDQFSHKYVYDVGNLPSDAVIGDFNGDGYVDLAVANAGDDTVSILLGNGNGTFEPQTASLVFGVGNEPVAIDAFDLDADGHLDLAVANKGENTVSILYGRGDGTFRKHRRIATGREPMDVALGDVDGDSLGDIVVANSLDNSVWVMRAVMPGMYGPAKKYTVGRLPVSVALGDLNPNVEDPTAPLSLDIVTANRVDGTVSVLMGDGQGNFLPSAAYPAGDGPVSVRIIDLDPPPTGIGIPEVVTAHFKDGTVNILSSNATMLNTLSSPTAWSVGQGPMAVTFGDALFADGLLDIISANYRGHSVTVVPCAIPVVYYDTMNAVTQPAGDGKLRYLQGDKNLERAQGQLIIGANEVVNSLINGITVDAGDRDAWPHPGSPVPLREMNSQRLVPGVTIENNVVAYSGHVGILFSGDGDTENTAAAVLFGRIINNTIYGSEIPRAGSVGIGVTQNASPTLLNNIVANVDTGVLVDETCSSTVVDSTVYQGNGENVSGTAIRDTDILLEPNDPLFVDPQHRNFYLAAGSLAIDSSLDALADRPALVAVRGPLGIPDSPILAPETDLFGQLRMDDPDVSPPPGMGANVFKDRGAIDRVDKTGPKAALVDPLDNSDIDWNPADGDVFVAGSRLSQFTIQLTDSFGVGIDDYSVTTDKVQIFLNESADPLVPDVDYYFHYNTILDVITLIPAAGFWKEAATYKIVLDRSATGIRDVAANRLQANRLNSGTTQFTVAISEYDYGDAPDPTYPSLRENDGARHRLIGGYYLGQGVTGEKDANLKRDLDGNVLSDQATGDDNDDGVTLPAVLLIGSNATVRVQASKSGGYLDAWADFNQDGDWDDPGERIFDHKKLNRGMNSLTVTVPSQVLDADTGELVDVTLGRAFLRFRYSQSGVNSPIGEAPTGEVEDYHIDLVDVLVDYGDAPSPYPTLRDDDGASHSLGSGRFLGAIVDSEINGQPNSDAIGDDLNGTIESGSVVNDEDGVAFVDMLRPGATATIRVTASMAGYLNAWIDFNGDGLWNTEVGNPEWIFQGQLLAAGENLLDVSIPIDAVEGFTFGRFRFSSQETLLPTGHALNGEVEDYQVLIISTPYDYGDAPHTYGTTSESKSATAVLHLAGANNDLLLTAMVTGAEANGINIVFTHKQKVTGNTAQVEYNAADRNLIIDIDPAATTAQTVLDAINAHGMFSAKLDHSEDPGNNGAGLITVIGKVATTDGGYDGFGTDAARHVVGSGLFLGETVDVEYDGQPHAQALGDDIHDVDDEDGIIPPSRIVAGLVSQFMVDVTMGTQFTEAYLNAWLDINQDGVFTDDEQVLAGVSVVNGTQEIAASIPVTALGGATFMRFRLSSEADLSPLGAAPDGEIEDYLVEITQGDSFISGWKFDDRNKDGVKDVSEPGLPGVTIYMDINNDGVLNRDTQGAPTEPVTLTRYDDLSTNDVNETGYYEFAGLLGQSDPYTVREELPVGWVSTYPYAGVVLPDGSLGGVDDNGVGFFTVFLAPSEQLTDVNFGNYRRPHVTVDDVQVVEGNSGDTLAYVTVTLYDSFGAAVDVIYSTQDGTAIVGSDYRVANGTLTFPAQNPPAPSWTQNTITTGTSDFQYQASGKYVVWSASDGHDTEIYLYNGVTTVQLTNNETSDLVANVFDNGSNPHVVWTNHDGTDTEVWFYDGTSSKQLTMNNHSDSEPQVSGSYVTWWSAQTGTDNEIFAWKIGDLVEGQPNVFNLSDNDVNDSNPRVSGDKIVWTGYRNPYAQTEDDLEIFAFDGTENPDGTPHVIQVTSNSGADRDPQIDGNLIVWQGRASATSKYEIFLYDLASATTTQITSNSTEDRYPQISDTDVVWQGYDEYNGNLEIFHYNTVAQNAPANISQNWTTDEQPRVKDGRVVWHGSVSGNFEIFTRDLRGNDGVINVTNSAGTDRYPQIGADSTLVWRTKNGATYGIVVATPNVPSVTQTIVLRVIGNTIVENDEYFKLLLTTSGPVDIGDGEATIWILNDDGQLDYGDAPDTYHTLLTSNGARHNTASGLHLGVNVDAFEETDGQPNETATGDDIVGIDDEDGVQFDTILGRGGKTQVTVTASSPGYLNAWIDYNRDGDWDDAGEQVFTNQALPAGPQTLDINVPATAIPGATYARFRLSADSGPIQSTGYVPTGEVEDYRVEIMPNPPVVSNAINLVGTPGDDLFEVWSDPNPDPDSNPTILRVTINGAAYELSRVEIDEVNFDGLGGNDTVLFHTAQDYTDAVEMWPDHGSLLGQDGTGAFSVLVNNVEQITALDGSDGDTAVMHGSTGTDLFEGDPMTCTLAGAGYALRAEGFPRVEAIAGAGGLDSALLHDSGASDLLRAWPNHAEFAERNNDEFDENTAYRIVLNGFGALRAESTGTGSDLAHLYDSAADNETFTGTPTSATLDGDGYELTVDGFEGVISHSVAGGIDQAYLYDSAGNDRFESKPAGGGNASYASLQAVDGSYYLLAEGFRYNVATAINGGRDTAYMYASDGNDSFDGYPTYSTISGVGFYHRVNSFEEVTAYASFDGGPATANNLARLHDSSGNDTFTANRSTNISTLTGPLVGSTPSFIITTHYFRYVNAFAQAGGNDIAKLTGSAGSDTYIGNGQQYGWLYRNDPGEEYAYRAFMFDEVIVNAGDPTPGKNDVAYLYDSALNDLLVATIEHPDGRPPMNSVRLSDLEQFYIHQLYDFDQVTAKASNNGDKKQVAVDVAFLTTLGPWTDQ